MDMQSRITPVAVFPGLADTLSLRAGSLGPPPQYYYALQSLSADTPPVATTLKDGNVSMTDAQWNAWNTDTDDDTYQLSCIAANLGLTLAS